MKQTLFLILLFMINMQDGQARHSGLNRADFQTTVDGKQTDLYYLSNKNGVEIAVTNFGARVVEIWAPDKNGWDMIMSMPISISKVNGSWVQLSDVTATVLQKVNLQWTVNNTSCRSMIPRTACTAEQWVSIWLSGTLSR